MSRNLTILFIVAVVLLALAILSGLVWANTLYIRFHPGEKDFLIPWLAARTFLQYGDSPYSTPAAQRAQIVYYGRLAVQNEDPLYLWLPLPVELFYFPFALIPEYAVARGLWMTCLEAALVALGFLSLQLTGWQPGRTLRPVFLLVAVFWVYAFYALINGSAMPVVVLALVGFLLALRSGRDELAGALLLPLLCAPRMTGVFLILMLWWLLHHRRWRVFAGLIMTLVILLLVSFFFLPAWFQPFLRGLILHAHYAPELSVMRVFASWSPVFGPRLGWVLFAGMFLVLFLEWGSALEKDFHRFLWVIALTLSATPLLGVPLTAVDGLLLFIPLTFCLSVLADRWSRSGRWGAAGIALMVLFLGFWMLIFTLSNIAVPEALAEMAILPLPVLLVLVLYWMRWWVIRPPRTELESIR